MKLLTNEQYLDLVSSSAAWQTRSELLQDRLDDWKKYIDALHQQLKDQTSRADRAVDELLALRGLPPISPPREMAQDMSDVLTEDPEQVAKIEERMKAGDMRVFLEAR